MSKHTPGPWIVDGDDISPAHDETLGICAISPVDVGGGKGWFRGVQTHSNAHLIAAAPLLLAACIQAREFLKTISHNTDDMDALDAAIAAAEGEA